MVEMKYPIGVQTFSNIIEGGFTYVDKTGYIKELLLHGKFKFLSRPRRFGKSLLLSTLEAYFEARRDLFKGLAIDGMDVDWKELPVLHFDFNNGLYEAASGLELRLHTSIENYERQFGLRPGANNRDAIPVRFETLIREVYNRTGQQVVILVDEYDKPLLAVEDNREVFEKNQALLKSFYGNLKSMDRYIRFGLITGVARFNKVSIFSDLNNLDDISLSDQFADICGWTEEELVGTFTPGIEELAVKRKENFDQTLKALRYYYDGYLFAEEGSRLYNPFSVLRALKSKRIDPYWFETGTLTFLVKRIRKLGIYPAAINGVRCAREQLLAVGMNDPNPAPLMFQTGYLTIDSYDCDRYVLRFPNREVEIGFYRQLLPMYAPLTNDPFSTFSFFNFQDDLSQGRPEDFMKRLATLLKDLPGEDHCESAYRAITYLLAVLSGVQSVVEHHGYLGCSDIEVITRQFIYVFEFKYNKTVQEAMNQIETRDYAGRYAMDSRNVYLIGANFIESKTDRGLHYEIRKLSK